MRARRRAWVSGFFSRSLSVVWLGTAALVACSSPGESPSEAVVGTQRLLTEAQQKTACALLDDPEIRPRLDGLEMKLLILCGRVPLPTRDELGRPSEPGAARFGARGEGFEASGGVDVAVSDPALDTGGHSTQSETSTVAVGQVVCSAWNDAGEGFGTNGFSGFGFSLNGGATFTDGGAFPNGPSDTNRGDPSLVFSVKDQTFYYGALSTQGLSLWKSTTNCQSFQYVGPIHVGSADDKELMAVDNTPTSPFFGRLYVGWTNFGASTDLNMAVFSDNGGATWSSPAVFPGSSNSGQGVYPAIAPNGDIFMALLKRTTPQDQLIYKSTNGGVSWVPATNIATGQTVPQDATATSSCGRAALRGPIRYLPSPQIVITRDLAAPAGYVIHSVYSYDADGSGPDAVDVFYRRSTDGAQSWAPEVRLNDDTTTTDQFFPALGASEAGGLVASWYDRRLDPANTLLDRYATFSVDNGQTWLPNRRLSDVSSQVGVNFDGLATCYHGDYDQVAASGNTAYVVWSDDRRVVGSQPNPDIYEDKIVLGSTIVASPATIEGGTGSTGAAFLGSAALADTTVSLSSSAPALVMVPGSVVVPAGSQSATFPITSVPTGVETAVTITGTFPGPSTATTVVTVLASPIVSSVGLSPTVVVGGTPSTATVTLSGPAPAGGATVALASNNTAVATVPATLAIPAGATQGTFTVTTVAATTSASVTISASFHNATRTATLTVTRAPTLSALSLTPTLFEGGRSATGTVVLVDPAPAGGAVVTLSSSNPAAATVPPSVTVAAGSSSATFTVTTSPVTVTSGITITAVLVVTRTASLTIVPSPTVTALAITPPSVVGGQPASGTVTLSGPAPAAGSTVTLVSSSPFAVVPSTLAVAPGASSAVFPVATTAPGVDAAVVVTASLNGISQTAPLTVTSPPGNAAFDSTLKVPRCTTVDSFCDTGSSLVRGRDTMAGGAEPNQPNTLAGSCADGTAGTFHSDESLDRVRISTVDGSPLAAGKMVRVDATVWVFSSASNHLDLFFAPDANNPVWTPIQTDLVAAGVGQQTVSVTFTLPAGSLPAIRPQWRFNGGATTCDPGTFSDRDDLVFAIGTGSPDTTPPTASVTAPASGATVRGTIAVTASASDDRGVSQVALLVDGAAVATDLTAPYSFTLDTTTLTAGGHTLQARASDAAGNTGTSAPVSITVDNLGPTVAVTSPAAGASVTGLVTITATATDSGSGVASVGFLVDGVLIGTDTTTPFTFVWDTGTAIPGGHTLSARATDIAGNQTTSSTVAVTVVVNQPPVVNAGPDKVVTLPATLAITGTVTDDGLPAPSTLTVTWSRTSGPGTVTFAPPTAASTTATFSTAGTYVLRLTASDGALSAFDEVQVVVSAAGTGPCTGLCTNPISFTVNGSFQSGNIGTGAVCYQTTSTLHGGNCGNFVSPRVLKVNGTTEPCTGGNWPSLPAKVNGGYCIQTTTGNQPWAFFTAF
jgi:hypothetical protein